MDWQLVLIQPVQVFFSQLMGFLPNVLGALFILLVGWAVAKGVEGVIVKLLKTAKLDKLADKVQLTEVLSKGGIKRKLSEVIGVIIYWLVTLVVLIATLNALQLTVAAQLLEHIVAFLPNVVAAIFILVAGIVTGAFLASTVRTAASNAGVDASRLLGQAVQAIVVIFAISAALRQLQIQLVGEAFLIVLAAVSFGLALAFGLGCKDQAGRWFNGVVDELSSKRR
ncbi:MAG TPA: hypothetical protein DDX89_07895 [Candidatus Omnitrophica bacterium]|nr:MAG: hypothetical protein A2Z92_06895 [Omnitrophica WOR_2 bacterium GWA2_63_20]OGX16929.1 MAG: hypothetical protein A2105_01045 [Omnitrophica WOR_2 bacterium GWF2_63_9]OGX34729.1 MAG: hypothetical protein A3B73_00090 [Omnitrophica WOR_2 bacterium RIFCSPHIGHO2_02_FULL_63_39]OGX44298.1 MAG: hypothetical protein A3I71_00785 [Omnitrophica WOR_2 bacterium RIFCSPLOWO2_02_FULL_63_16]OGX47459.1 MAG: hypothetical protein A3G88_00275 [Omnitrophica WOR_2 bacterium RIFCSPLOWO2_12_FULL_63_16]HAM41217.1 